MSGPAVIAALATGLLQPAGTNTAARRNAKTPDDLARLAAAEARRQRRAAKRLGHDALDAATVEALRAGIAALGVKAPPTIAAWSLGPSERPFRLETSIGVVFLMDHTLLAQLKHQCELRDPVTHGANVLAGVTGSLMGSPIVNIDDGGENALRVMQAVKDALGRLG